MQRLDVADAPLTKEQQVRRFIKGIIDPHYHHVVSKIREIIHEKGSISILDCYSRLRSEENWINVQAGHSAKVGAHSTQIGAAKQNHSRNACKTNPETQKMIEDKR